MKVLPPGQGRGAAGPGQGGGARPQGAALRASATGASDPNAPAGNVFGIKPKAKGEKPYKSPFQPSGPPVDYSKMKLGTSDPYAAGGIFGGVPHKQGAAGPYKGSAFVNTPAGTRPAPAPVKAGDQPGNAAPPQQSVQLGQPSHEPEGTIIRGRTTGQYMIVKNGVVQTASPADLQARGVQ